MASLSKLPSSSRFSKAENGLTIIETMVSIAVFTFLIVLCIGLFIFLGRIYYRGLYENRAQEVARTIVDSVAEAIRTSGAEIDGGYQPYTPDLANKPWETWNAYCIGSIQYSYKLNVQLVAEDTPGDYESDEVFVAARGCNSTDAGAPVDVADPNTIMTAGMTPVETTELLSDRMRLLEFSVNQVGNNQDFYRIRIKIAVGGDASDLLYDKTVFEYINHPCTLSTEVPIPVSKTDCEDGLDDIKDEDPMTPALEAADNGMWDEPDTPANSIHQNDDALGLGYKNDMDWAADGPPDAIIYQCQDAESFCSVIEIETKVFRRIL